MIMKMLSNNKGVSLVVLIVAMTLIAILGVSFVSLMGTKQKSVIYQTDSYRALNIANAGVEYAIRYVGDHIDTTGTNQNDFFHNPAAYPEVPVVSSLPDTTNLNTTQWNRVDFGNGRFYLSYYLNTANPDDSINNKILYSVGVYGQTERLVKLKKYLAYASPTSIGLGRLNLVPNSRPSINGNYLIVPVMHLYDGNTTTDITISSIQVTGDFSNNFTKELREIYFRNNNIPGGTLIYSYSSYPSFCSAYPAPPGELPCRHVFPHNCIEIPDNGPSTLPLNFLNVTMPPYSIRWFFFRFNESGNLLNGFYTITFNTVDDGVSDSSIIRFSVP